MHDIPAHPVRPFWRGLLALSLSLLVAPCPAGSAGPGLAAALAQACPWAGGALAQGCAALQTLDPMAREQAIVGLTPYQFLSQIAVPLKIWPKQISLRMPAGFAPSATGEESAGAGSGSIRAEAGRFGYFAQAKYQGGAYRQAPAAFKADAYTLTMGGDYRFSERLLAGLALAYTRQETAMSRNPGDMRTDAYRVAGFGNYYLPGDFYLDWLAIYSRHANAVNRDFSLPGLAGRATSHPGNDLYSVALSLGRDTAWREWQFASYARAEYMNLHIPAYAERGGQGWALRVDGQTDESLTLAPGVQISRAFGQGWGVLTPAVRFEYEHQFLNGNQPIGLQLIDAPAGTGAFVMYTGAPDRDYFNLGGSLAATWPGGVAAFLRYESRLGQNEISNHIVEAGVGLPL